MNRLENWFCSSSFWRKITRQQILPWLLEGSPLGEHVLEVGAGPGAATEQLRKLAPRVTSLEYSHDFAAGIVRRDLRNASSPQSLRNAGSKNDFTADGSSHHEDAAYENRAVLQGDASALPFPDRTFSTAIAVLVLHHLKSLEAQERAFAEVFRVLRPGGLFLALDIPDGWVHRLAHIRSTFVPIAPATAPARLAAAGFSGVQLAFRRGAFRICATRPG